ADIVIGSGGAMTFNRSDASSYSGIVSGAAGNFTKTGAGLFTLTSASTFTGSTTISAGTLQIGAGGTSGSWAGSIVANATLAFNRSDAFTHTGAISGTGNVKQNGPGTLTLSGSNS